MKIGNLEVYGIIYKITNIINGKVYIGQTVQDGGFDTRYRNNLEKTTHNEHLKNSIDKYGIESFKISKILDVAFSKEELDIKEMCWIRIYDSTNRDKGYNKNFGGATWIPNEETKIKMGKASKDRWKDEAYKNKMKQIISETHWDSSGINNPRSTKIVCLNTLDIFDYGKLGSEKYNCNYSHLIDCCKGNRKTCGIHPITKERLVWVYYDDYMQMTEENIKERIHNALTIKQNKKLHIVKTNFKLNKIDRMKGKNNPNAIKVICITTKKIFDTAMEASTFYNCNNISICQCCKGDYKTAGKLDNGTPLVWMYYSEYLNCTTEEIENKIFISSINKHIKKVICVTTKKEFNTAKEASLYYKCDASSILKCCKGKYKFCGKLTDGTPLRWMYYEDYIKRQLIHNENLGQAI